MISLLIPVYNYKIVDLVTNLHKQLQLSHIEFEILCLDDASAKNYSKANKTINALEHVTYNRSNKNKGRTQTRQNLALLAKYNWLLFLDADVLPKSKTFIKTYLTSINTDYDAVFGGFAYYDKRPENKYMLRWKYGTKQEQKSAKFRNKKPYKIIISANFLIRKKLFLSINATVNENTYGLDNIFGARLKHRKAKVHHINNEVYHLGIEESAIYLKKKEDSANAVLAYYKTEKIKVHENDLLHLFIKLNKYKLNYVFALIYRIFENTMRRNLISSNPSIKLLQLYRISFMCYKDMTSSKSN